MSTPEFVAALLKPEAYAHPCGDLRLVETHISWVILTGDYAYKVKKPVRFDFLDFSTLALRAHFCEEELRCNRPFSEQLYLGVVTINRDRAGRYRVDGEGELVDYAVRMREFPSAQQLDVLLAAGGLQIEAMRGFGLDLADRHGRLPRLEAADDEVDHRFLEPVLDNFRTLMPLQASQSHREQLGRLEQNSRTAYLGLRPRLVQRLRGGFTRECHGDLHLSNLVMLEDRVRAFDCLEFNADLRWIDTACDLAFLLMDCSVRERSDLGYAFLDGYLARSADYEGAALSGFFQVYRSMVRAKVAALQLEAPGAPPDRTLIERLALHLEWADARQQRAPGMLLIMCGFSGSGKSWLAERLVPHLPAVRVSSDILRKTRAGLAPRARSGSPVDGGLYTRDQTRLVYADLLRASEDLLRAGEHVVADATFLDRALRTEFRQAARAIGSGCVVLHCRASRETLEARVCTREEAGENASEAGLEVLGNQLTRFDAITADELTIEVDTEGPLEIAALASGIRAALGSGGVH